MVLSVWTFVRRRVGLMATPRTIEELGIPKKMMEDLFLKTLYLAGELTLIQLSDHMCVALKIVEDIFGRLRREQLVQVTGMVGGVHQIVTTSEGKNRAQELLSISHYVGAAPVSLESYVERVREQSVRRMDVHPQGVAEAFEKLVLDAQVVTQLGTAVVSGRAIFLYGPPGTGKTTVAESLWRLYHQDPVWVPHAICVDGQIIALYDPGVHFPSDQAAPSDYDRRWVLCRRPKVVVGGELTIEMLDLQLSPSTRYYAAPLQMKANNGLL